MVVLTRDNFDEFIAKHPLAIVQFYAPWCGHCKAMAPAWSEAAKKAKQMDPPVPVAKLDAQENDALGAKYDVGGYPALKVFVNGKADIYYGAREADAIIAHLQKQRDFKLPQLAKPDELPSLHDAGHPVVLGVFRMPLSASAAFRAFAELAFDLVGQPVTFAYSASYATPPVLPLTADGKKPPVPGLVLISRAGGKEEVDVLAVPRKKEIFTREFIVDWLEERGVKGLSLPERSEDEGEKNFYEGEGEDSDDHDHYD